MAISIDWGTKIISVPKADTTLVQLLPIEIRSLNLNSFRLSLKDLEDDVEGMTFLDTHTHNGEVLLGGIVYARVLEIINGYTVTFEDGAYALNLVGANSNVGDVINFNQVSVRSSNAAGLISNSAIEFSSFNGGVTIDTSNITGLARSGTTFPIGTRQSPCNNLVDAHLICDTRGFTKVFVLGDAMIDSNQSWIGFEFEGESPLKSLITIDTTANVLNCEFYNAKVSGTLDGNTQINDSIITGLDFVDGFIYKCSIGPVEIKLGISTGANLFSCYSGVVGTEIPIINMNNTGILALRDYHGDVFLKNYNGTALHNIDLSSGRVVLDSASITSGTFCIAGIGKLVDEFGVNIPTGNWNTGVTIINDLMTANQLVLGSGVWTEAEKNNSLAWSRKASDNAESANLKIN
tara:strand:+ start:2185 stop:3402 length:1218 start_codon:yes stop_codon:yes gene_type:complete